MRGAGNGCGISVYCCDRHRDCIAPAVSPMSSTA
jgi:hypothetical protein